MRRHALAGLLCLLAAGCVIVPVQREVFDPDCRVMRREITVEAAAVGQFGRCAGQECAAALAALGVVAAASLVVSGSIAIVGNAVYWLEHAANCRRWPGPADAAPAQREPPTSSTMSAPAPP